MVTHHFTPALSARGMLTAAVTGKLFASPSTTAVIDTIRALRACARRCSSSRTIRRRQTQLSVSHWKRSADKRKCAMIVVGDDCAHPRQQRGAGRRGICGHRLWCIKSPAHWPPPTLRLSRSSPRAQSTANSLLSIGVAFTTTQLPNDTADAAQRIVRGKCEIGFGIHGEAGSDTVDCTRRGHTHHKAYSDIVCSRDADRDYFQQRSCSRLG